MSEPDTIAERVDRALASMPESWMPADGPVVVALSGGVDSTVLLHLLLRLRSEPGRSMEGRTIVAAHLDHGMREASAEDAVAVAELCRRWEVRCVVDREASAPESETAARKVRYAFLRRTARSLGGAAVLTGHHADDEVETLIHRIARGTGLRGLAGIPRRRGAYLRPWLLPDPPVGREDLERYAEEFEIPVRVDPTNRDLGIPRNRIRHRVLPELDAAVPGARARILRLARNARRTSAELQALADVVLGYAGHESARDHDQELTIPVDLWAEGSLPLRRALFRRAMERMGERPSEAATRAALVLPADSQSGRGIDLSGGLRFERRFDVWVLAPAADGPRDDTVIIRDSGPGDAELELPGSRLRLVWAPSDTDDPPAEGVALDPDCVEFPLVVRGWRPGDRIARPFGHVAVAKWMAESRIPRLERPDRVVVVDAGDRVVAVEGLGTAHGCAPDPARRNAFHLTMFRIR